jgi:tetratricopeptide (TPR) repeat protein
LQSAAEIERSVEKHPVTPGALMPPNEALGDLLMELGRPEEALEAYQASDDIWPERYNTLLGAARAAREAGEEELAEQFFQRLLTIAGDSDRLENDQALIFVEE